MEFVTNAISECDVAIEDDIAKMKLCIEFFEVFTDAMDNMFEQHPGISSLVHQ